LVVSHRQVNIARDSIVATDISARNETEAECKQAGHELGTQMLQLVLDTLPQRIFWKDKNFRYLGCNKLFAQDAGLESPKQIVGKHDFELAWRKSAPLYRADDTAVIQNDISKINYEEPQVREDGTILWLRTSKIPLQNEAGEVIGIFGCYEDITEHKQQEEILRNIALGVSAQTGEAFFQSLVQYLSKALEVEFVFAGEIVGAERKSVKTIAVYADGQVIDNFEYTLKGTPNEKLVGKQVCIYPHSVQQSFPEDPILSKIGAQSYIGIPLFNSAEEFQGLIAVLGRRALQDTRLMEEVLKIFAVRASSEFERQQKEAELRQQARREQALNRVVQAISNSLDLNTIFATATNEIAQLLQAERATVVQYLPKRQCWQLLAEYRQHPDKSDSSGLKIPDELNPFAVQLKRLEVLQVDNTDTIEDEINRELAPRIAGAWLSIPLIVSGSVWGYVGILKTQRTFVWSKEQVELVRVVADRLAIAVQQANLYQQAQLELAERKRAEAALQTLNEELELRVQQRTQELEYSRSRRCRREREFRTLVENSPDSIRRLDRTFRHVYVNPKVEGELGIPAAKILGKTIEEIGFPENLVQEWNAILQQACETRQEQVNEYSLSLPSVGLQYYQSRIVPELSIDGRVESVLVVVRDITTCKLAEKQLRASLKEKEILLKEIHHRVKNNLQLVSSLLHLQANSIQDPRILNYFQESQQRVKAMALIHEQLYRSLNHARINFAEYVQNLAASLFHSYICPSSRIDLRVEVKNVEFDVDIAIPCGLIINELVSNAIKHAFPDDRLGEIEIFFSSNCFNQNLLTIKDNGVGFTDDLDIYNTDSLGLQMVCDLTEQLGGRLELNQQGVTAFKIVFPL
jgi:PAS domain S-box-containing protein